jgi:hypothetical protein
MEPGILPAYLLEGRLACTASDMAVLIESTNDPLQISRSGDADDIHRSDSFEFVDYHICIEFACIQKLRSLSVASNLARHIGDRIQFEAGYL